MSTVLFVTWDGGGNVPPATAVARELGRRGHDVRFLGHRTQEQPLTDAGFRFVRPRHAREFSAVDGYSPWAMMATFGDTGMGRDLLDAVATEPTDLVVVDCLMFGAMDAARSAGLHYVVLEHLYDASYRQGILRGPMGANLRLRRLSPRRALEAADLRLVMTLPELDPVEAPNVRQVGPHAPWAPRTAAEPSVLVSLSTFGFPGAADVLQNLVDATEGLDARVVVSTGGAVDASALRVRNGVEVHPWVSHPEVMAETTVMVGHGGHGSTMTALAHDLPLLVVPLSPMSDQPTVGRSIEAAGAGRVASRKASPDQLRTAIAGLLDDGPHRTAAARLGAAVRCTDAAAAGADAVEAVLRDGAPARGPHGARP